jgi:hypothetical protein
MDEPVVVRLPPLAGGQAESWRALIEIAPQLGHHWLLIGGPDGFPPRGGARVARRSPDQRHRPRCRPPHRADRARSHSRRPHPGRLLAGRSEPGRRRTSLPTRRSNHRRPRPDHMGARATLSLGTGRTIEAPGTSQAFGRVSLVRVELDSNATGIVRRPTLVGALLGKVAAVTEIVSMSSAERAKHLRDVDALARLLGPADRVGASLTTKERLDARTDRRASRPQPVGGAIDSTHGGANSRLRCAVRSSSDSNRNVSHRSNPSANSSSTGAVPSGRSPLH